MLAMVSEIPDKNSFKRSACRKAVLDGFLDKGYEIAEFTPDPGDNPRRAYNGLLMAIKRDYARRIAISWRHGRIFLRRI